MIFWAISVLDVKGTVKVSPSTMTTWFLSEPNPAPSMETSFATIKSAPDD